MRGASLCLDRPKKGILFHPIGICFIRCLTERALQPYRTLCFRGRMDLTYVTDPALRPAAATGGLPPSVYSPLDGNQYA